MVITGRQTSREIRENILNSNRNKRAGSKGESNTEEQEGRRSITQLFTAHPCLGEFFKYGLHVNKQSF